MFEYTFQYGPFYFKVHAGNDQEAVKIAKRSIEESYPEDSVNHLDVDLTAGGFRGRLYIDTGIITDKNIYRREEVPELVGATPF